MGTSTKVTEILDEISIDDKQRVENIRIRHVIAESIKRLRITKALTQEELAIKVGLPREAISRIESGKHNPTIETITKIASSFNKEVNINFKDITN